MSEEEWRDEQEDEEDANAGVYEEDEYGEAILEPLSGGSGGGSRKKKVRRVGDDDDGDEEGEDDGGGGDDVDVMRNLDLLKQLGMLGPTPSKPGKKVASKKKKALPAPSRMSNRLKGAEPILDYAKPTSAQPIQVAGAERGVEPTSYRNLVTGTLETYDESHRASLAPRDAYTPYVEDSSEIILAPSYPPCQNCHLRSSRAMTMCATCKSPHGRICGRCLWQRYGENVAEIQMQTWKCPNCRGICNCTDCRLSQGWGSLGDSAWEEATTAGFHSVAHMMVDRRFKVDGTIDNDPNPVRKRGRPLGGGGEWLRRLRKVQRSCSFNHRPIVMQSGVVLSLGTIHWDRPYFSNSEYIYPVGYHVQRVQHIDGGGLFVMDLEILDGGGKPLFRAFALDKPDEVHTGSVSSTPITALLNLRAGKHRAISGPRYMYLDEVLIKAALHAMSIQYVLGNPQLLAPYRPLSGDAFVVLKGDWVAVRGTVPSQYFLARACHDAVVLRRDPFAFSMTVEWAECSDATSRTYVFPVGQDDVPSHSIFWHFSPGQLQHLERGSSFRLSKEVPDLVIECNQVWML